ncbi:chromosome 3 10 [Paragonimus westermani]|uniref:Chromosome 3 10 n=1 Tax=Paragonimus westermani TaxID=34504 RepID=A0A5J4NYY3_9TREM|nr:chromosome 3 10 [Paragonimus westermani]
MALDPQATKEIREDWQNRENIEVINTSMKSIVEFLNRFDSSCRLKLSKLESKLTNAEKVVDILEAEVQRSLSQQSLQQRSMNQPNSTGNT